MAEAPAPARSSGPLATARARRRYRVAMALLVTLSVLFALGLLAWNNPMSVGTDGFWRIAGLRVSSLIAMVIVALCQGMATVAFQTVANNRIVTPSILGFEALYRAVQTSAVYFLGVAGLVSLQGVTQFGIQVLVMVLLAVALYGWLLSGRYANLQVMLLVGIVLGGGLGSVSAFMQRLLTPSEFDVLAARLFGNVSNADPSYYPLAIPLCAVAGLLLWAKSTQLNLMALGRDTATALGLDHRRELMQVLFLVSILMAVSTALVGPMTFLGFLVATLTYQLAGTYDHRRIFPMVVLVAFVTLAGAYVVMRNVFYAQGVVSIIIEMVGGTVFLIVILRKGRL